MMSNLQSKNSPSNDLNELFPTTSCGSVRDPLDILSMTFTGFFNGFNVELRSPEDMVLHKLGCFGKGSASRSRPVAQTDCLIMRNRQFQKRKEWYKKFSKVRVTSNRDSFLREVDKLRAKILKEGEKRNNDVVNLVSSDGSSDGDDDDDDDDDDWNVKKFAPENITPQNMALVVPDSGSEFEENSANKFFDCSKVKCCVNQATLQEKLMLTLQEAFFLMYGFGCLQIIDMEHHILNIEQAWELFKQTDKNFVNKYIVYHYFRSKGYIVKPGIKFGGDYLLYRYAPEHAHSDYVVVIKNESNETDWLSTLGHVRMANTTVKEILVAEVVSPLEPGDMPEGLENYSVRTTVLTRNMGTINEDE